MEELCDSDNWTHMQGIDDRTCMLVMPTPFQTTLLVFHIFLTIVPVLFSLALAVIVSRKVYFSSEAIRFAADFLLIVIPIILNVTIANPYVEVICVILSLVLYLVFRKFNINPFVDEKHVVSLGRQPDVLTLVRSSINIITAVCILAVDFSSFPKSFRKSRTYGVGLMDLGIGLFVFRMGVVSRPPRVRADFMKIPKMVGPALLLGLARTVVIRTIEYHQDETEYGIHMNAFFTLGLTKLLGGIVSAMASTRVHLLLIGLFILAVHELALQSGLGYFLMDPTVSRESFFHANREGICSLPGFVSIYLISMYISQYMFSESTLLIGEYTKKVKMLAIGTLGCWIVLFICVFTTGISRRIANLGYVTLTFSNGLTMLLLFILIFDYAFSMWTDEEMAKVPPLMEAINHNGLLIFLISNILTGVVNMFLEPGNRGRANTIGILSVYMLTTSAIAYVLLRLKIKIA